LATWLALIAVPGAWLIPTIFWETHTPTVLVGIVTALVVGLVGGFWLLHRVAGVTMFCGMIAVVILAGVPNMADAPATWLAHLSQLVYYRKDLLRREAELQSRGANPAIVVLGVDGFGSLSSGLALDRTGEIMLPADKRSPRWNATGGQTELSVDTCEARHIVGDYYFWFHF
jgi:hypothetical protein